VCESPDVEHDEAFDDGLWLLSECGRCGHRWTAGPLAGPLPAVAQVRPVRLDDQEGQALRALRVEGLVGAA
jgi:hypothetical protein